MLSSEWLERIKSITAGLLLTPEQVRQLDLKDSDPELYARAVEISRITPFSFWESVDIAQNELSKNNLENNLANLERGLIEAIETIARDCKPLFDAFAAEARRVPPTAQQISRADVDRKRKAARR